MDSTSEAVNPPGSRKLGLHCDPHFTRRALVSDGGPLACFPMYHGLRTSTCAHLRAALSGPIANFPGVEEIREGVRDRQTGRAHWEIDDEHRRVLGTMLSAAQGA